jgi:outer membrane protein assembly factor BamB
MGVRMRLLRVAKLVMLAGFCLSFPMHAQEWPQFRGPSGQGLVTASGLPVEWSETTNVAWKTAVPGLGWSSPVIGYGRVWLTTAVIEGTEASLRVIAFDQAAGRVVQNTEVFRVRNPRAIHQQNSHASPTIILAEDRLYAHFGSEGTAALGLDGAITWKARHGCETQHGNGGSPVLWNDLLIFTCDGFDAAYLIALDIKTGKERWKTWRRQPWSHAYATPLIVRVGESDQIISPGAYYVGAYDPGTGREVWRVGYGDGFSNVPRPVSAHGLVFIATGFQEPSLLAIRFDGKGDVTRTHVAWRTARAAPYTPSPIVAGDQLYMLNDIGIVSCLEARTGALLWQQRLPGNYTASPVMADGLIFIPSEEGVITVIKPGAAFQAVAQNKLNGPMLASMAAADRSWYIRSATHLYRITAQSGQSSVSGTSRPIRATAQYSTSTQPRAGIQR